MAKKKSTSRRKVATAKSKLLNCRACGLCCTCQDGQDRFCNVLPADELRLSKRYVKLNVLHPSTFDVLASALDGRVADAALKTKFSLVRTGPLQGKEFTSCVALMGSVGHRVHCSIYRCRPSVCYTAVRKGDKVCLYLRKRYLAGGVD
jgi:Fe-S-cluster containining protein